jgi:Cu(I)/Ag(I) efflux system membrane fusion protein
MKINTAVINTSIISILVGLVAGYFIFGSASGPEATSVSNHVHEEVGISDTANEQIWTCSMHPQIRQNEFGQCPICGMDLIPMGSSVSDDPLVLQMTKEAVRMANIETYIIGSGNGSTGIRTIRLSGKVQADERLASSQVIHIPGRIEKLYVTFTGDRVVKGQKLAEIYSPELINAQRELLEANKLKDVNPELLNAARNKLKFWKVDNEVISQIEEKGIIREIFSVYADESGVVRNRKVSIGDYVSQGQVLFDLMDLDKVWVLFDAYEEDLAYIREGNRIRFSVSSIPNREFNTRITFIDPVINADTRTTSLRAEVSNSSSLLKPEMLVYGTLERKIASGGKLYIPKSAVLWTGVRSVVYVKMPDMDIPSFQFREVELGEAAGNEYEVVSGVEAGEEIVTHGNFTIDAAAQLNNQASMMNRDVFLKKEETGMTPNFHADTPGEFKEQLKSLADRYLILKDAFVDTDHKKASEAASDFVENLQQVNMNLLTGDAHVYWMEQQEIFLAHGERVAEMEDIEDQRKQFGYISDALIKSIEAFGIQGDTLFVQYCPMAFKNSGADWIASDETIRNPYFGDKMMKCGNVKRILQGDQKMDHVH